MIHLPCSPSAAGVYSNTSFGAPRPRQGAPAGDVFRVLTLEDARRFAGALVFRHRPEEMNQLRVQFTHLEELLAMLQTPPDKCPVPRRANKVEKHVKKK